MKIEEEAEKLYGNRLRLRVSGICIQNDRLLLVQHHGLGPAGELWAPPGGGMEWGSSAIENLKREFLEETGLQISVGSFLFVEEYLAPPLHAVELFFEVHPCGGKLVTGTDPESSADAQLIRNVSFVAWHDLKRFDPQTLHQCLQQSSSLQDLKSRSGYFNFSL